MSWWSHYMRTVFLDSSPCLVTDLLKKKKPNQKCVGLHLQKSFLWVEKGLSFHTCSGTHLLTQSFNSAAAHLRHEAGLEKLYPLCYSSILLQNRGNTDTATASMRRPTSVLPVPGTWCRRTWAHPQLPTRGPGLAATPWRSRRWDAERAAANTALQPGLPITLAELVLEADEESWWLGQMMTSLLSAVGPPPALQCLC